MHHPTDRIINTTAFVEPVVICALPGSRNSSVGPQWRIDPTTHRTTSERSYHGVTSKHRKEMTHSTHFIYGYMASDIWLRTILIVRKETRCRHIGYSFRLTAMVLLYAPSHRQDSTYHGLCYTSRGALVGMRNSSMGPPWRIDPTTQTQSSGPERIVLSVPSWTSTLRSWT